MYLFKLIMFSWMRGGAEEEKHIPENVLFPEWYLH